MPAAQATGNLTLRANTVVERLEYDSASGKISRVHVIDTVTRERSVIFRKNLFPVCVHRRQHADPAEFRQRDRFPNGLANRSGVLGHYMMDHTLGVSGIGVFLDNMDSYYHGNRPTGLYIPRFRNLNGQDEDADFVRGYGYQTATLRMDWQHGY